MENILKKVEELNLGKVNLLALVTTTSYEVVFYVDVKGKTYQSNSLIEEGIADSLKVDTLYKEIAKIVRESKEFNPDKLNVVKVNKKDEIDISYEQKDCRVHAIKKEWRNNL